MVQQTSTLYKQVFAVNEMLGLMEKIIATYLSVVNRKAAKAAMNCPRTHKNPRAGHRLFNIVKNRGYVIAWRDDVIAREYTPTKKSLTARFATNSIVGSFLRDFVVTVVTNTVKFKMIINGAKKYSA